MEFGTHHKSNMLIMNIILAIVYTKGWLKAQNDYGLQNLTNRQNRINCFKILRQK